MKWLFLEHTNHICVALSRHLLVTKAVMIRETVVKQCKKVDVSLRQRKFLPKIS